jgi:hypothetical protein
MQSHPHLHKCLAELRVQELLAEAARHGRVAQTDAARPGQPSLRLALRRTVETALAPVHGRGAVPAALPGAATSRALDPAR